MSAREGGAPPPPTAARRGGRELRDEAPDPRALRATGGKEVTPSGWEPGKKVLHPGPDLVGRVWEVWQPKDDE